MLLRIALALLLFLPACLEFDAQEVVLHYDQKQDQLDVLLLYRGLYSTSSTPEKDLEQLDRVLATGQFALWSNWPLNPDLTHADGVMAPFAAHCDVENGGFFTTPAGELCGYQFVRIRDVKGLLQKLNTVIALGLQTQVLHKPLAGGHELDDDTKELLQDVVRGRSQIVSLQGSAIVLTLPCSDADHRWLMQRLGDELLDDVGRELGGRLWRMQSPKPEGADVAGGHGGEAPDQTSPDTMITIARKQLQEAVVKAAETRFLFENPINLQRLEDRTVLSLGWPHVEDNVLQKGHDDRYRPNLEPLLRERKIAFEQGVPEQEIERRFAAFHARAAVLPPDLAAMRKQ